MVHLGLDHTVDDNSEFVFADEEDQGRTGGEEDVEDADVDLDDKL